MLLKTGSKGSEVSQLQKFLKITADGNFGSITQKAVMDWQQQNNLTPDGIAGPQTLAKMQTAGLLIVQTSPPSSYENITIQGSTFPGQAYNNNLNIKLNIDITKTYIPAFKTALPDIPKGMELLMTIMTYQEGFNPKTKSYKTNNPGNINNTDNGSTKAYLTLAAGIIAQKTIWKGSPREDTKPILSAK